MKKREKYEKLVTARMCEKKTCRKKTNWFLTVILPPKDDKKEPEVVSGYVCLECCMNRSENNEKC